MGTGGAGGAGQGGAGQGGAGQGGAGQGGGGGAAPAVKADHLGEICGPMKACPAGYSCTILTAGAMAGFCTLKCGGPMDMTTCADGFPGPGKPLCNIQLKDMMMNTFPACGIACGDQYMPALPPDCPTGLTCKDLTGPNMMADGKTDLCAP